MASCSSSHQQNRELNAFSGIEPAGRRREVCESSRLFDVFINHRGPDVKQTLATELYNSLRQLGIHAFLDSQEKELGRILQSVPRNLNMIGRAVDGAESILNEYLFSDIGADALTEIVTQNSSDMDINEWCRKWEVTRTVVIGCFVVVVDSSTSAEDINKSLQLVSLQFSQHQFSSHQFYLSGHAKTWPKVRKGEWIITMAATDYWGDFFYYKNMENILSSKGVMKKGFRVEVKKGEEWKNVSVLHTIVDRLHQ